MCERLLREAIKKNTELEKELEFYKNYIEKLDNLNAKDFIFKEELEENYVPKAKIREKIEELKDYSNIANEQIKSYPLIVDSDSLNFGRVQAHIKDMQVLRKLLGDEIR